MSDVFGFKEGQPVMWYHKDLAKSNQHCPYCGNCVGVGSEVVSDKEHLVGREFVPKGSLDRGFNFIFRACKVCNAKKSSAERHISSVTLFNSPSRWLNESINAIAVRKASKDYHPDQRGILVKDASHHHSIELGWAGAQMKFDSIGPPQVNSEEVKLLAWRHIQGMLAMIMTDDPRIREKPIHSAETIFYFEHYTYSDWGNPQLMEIVRRSLDWECHARIVTANGHFKALIKSRKNGEREWFWALEWNKFLRIVGAVCPSSRRPELLSDLPELDWRPSPDGMGRSRRESPLPDTEDILFPNGVAEG